MAQLMLSLCFSSLGILFIRKELPGEVEQSYITKAPCMIPSFNVPSLYFAGSRRRSFQTGLLVLLYTLQLGAIWDNFHNQNSRRFSSSDL
jgi:hypothetical protein